MNDEIDRAATNQSTLVNLLLSLHVLFGITALIAVIICHTRKQVTAHTPYDSHRVWHIWTFWTGVIGYVAGFYYWHTQDSTNILILTFVWVYYRVIHSWLRSRNHKRVGLRSIN